jgi:RNA polymerase sigma-70 factor (sigma-E family)
MGKDEEFAEFVTARWRTLVRSAVLLGASRPEAEDLAQTTLMRVWVAWSKVVRADDRDAYVAKILVNTFRQSRRRRWWGEHPTRDVPESVQPDETAAADDADAVRRSLRSLSPGQREAVVLRYYAHLSERQIAEALGVAPGTVKSRVSRGLSHLAEDPGLALIRDGRTS